MRKILQTKIQVSEKMMQIRYWNIEPVKLRLFFDDKIGSGSKASVIEELAPESHKPLIKKFKRKKVCAKFKDNICAVYLAEMLPLSFGN